MTVVPCNVFGGNSAKCSSVVQPVKIPGLWSQTGIQKHGQKLMMYSEEESNGPFVYIRGMLGILRLFVQRRDL